MYACNANAVEQNYSTHLKSNKLHMFQMLKFCQQLLNPSHSNETNVCPIEEEMIDTHVMKRLSAALKLHELLTACMLHTATSEEYSLCSMDYFSNRLVSLKGVTFANVGNLLQACLQTY